MVTLSPASSFCAGRGSAGVAAPDVVVLGGVLGAAGAGASARTATAPTTRPVSGGSAAVGEWCAVAWVCSLCLVRCGRCWCVLVCGWCRVRSGTALGRVERGARRCWSSTATTMITPLATAWVEMSWLFRVKTLLSVVKIRTPKTVPTMVPRPPESSVPPMTTAAIASSSKSLPWVELPVDVRRDQHERGEPAAEPDQDVEHHGVPLDVDAGEAGGLGVAADGERAAAEGGAVQQHPAGRGDQREDDHQHRYAERCRRRRSP